MKGRYFRNGIVPLLLTLLVLVLASQCQNPTTPTTSTTRYFLYATDSAGPGVYAYSIDTTTGALSPVSGSPFGTASNTQGIAADPSGRYLYVTSSSNEVWAFTIDTATGALASIGPAVSNAGSPTAVLVDPTGNYLYVANNSANTVSAYTIDTATGVIALNGTPQGTGGTQPSGLAITSSGSVLYAVNGGANPYLVGFDVDASGRLGSFLPTTLSAAPSDLTITSSGSYLYTDLSGGTFYGFPVDAGGLLGGGTTNTFTPNPFGTPLGLAADPTNSYLYVADYSKGAVVGMSINPSDGSLTLLPTPSYTIGAGANPWTVRIDPTGKFLYAPDSGTSDIAAFEIASDGALSKVSGSPFAAGTTPTSLAIVKTTSP